MIWLELWNKFYQLRHQISLFSIETKSKQTDWSSGK